MALVTQILGPMLVGNQEFDPEPPLVEEKIWIYISQILVPLTISGETHAFMGSLPSPDFGVEIFKAFSLCTTEPNL